jgi:hypothetical protein
MSKNLMSLFKLINIYLKNMNIYLLSHIALFTGRNVHFVAYPGRRSMNICLRLKYSFHLPWAEISWPFRPGTYTLQRESLSRKAGGLGEDPVHF